MTYTTVFHPEALNEFREASLWYEAKLNGLGLRFESAIEEKLILIVNNPLIYPKKKGNFRQATITAFRFIIVYKVNASRRTIYISSIFHTRKNPKKKFRGF